MVPLELWASDRDLRGQRICDDRKVRIKSPDK
jgi:hypothetical protein